MSELIKIKIKFVYSYPVEVMLHNHNNYMILYVDHQTWVLKERKQLEIPSLFISAILFSVSENLKITNYDIMVFVKVYCILTKVKAKYKTVI